MSRLRTRLITSKKDHVWDLMLKYFHRYRILINAKCDSNWAPTEFHLNLHKRTEYSDVLLETMFNLVLNAVNLHSQNNPENVPKTPLITPKAPEIMHWDVFVYQASPLGIYSIFLCCPLPKFESNSVHSKYKHSNLIPSTQIRIQFLTF